MSDPAPPVGVFETIRVVDGVARDLDAHLARLRRSAEELGLAVVLPELQHAGTGRLRITTLPSGTTAEFVPFTQDPAYQPVHLLSRPVPRRVPPWLKHTHRDGWDGEQLFVDRGLWLEGSRGNFFVVRDGVLLTAPLDGRILGGLTRARVLRVAAVLGLPFREEAVPVGPVDEVFVTSALKLVAPVVALDDAPMPGSGPLTERIVAYFAGSLGLTRSSV